MSNVNGENSSSNNCERCWLINSSKFDKHFFSICSHVVGDILLHFHCSTYCLSPVWCSLHADLLFRYHGYVAKLCFPIADLLFVADVSIVPSKMAPKIICRIATTAVLICLVTAALNSHPFSNRERRIIWVHCTIYRIRVAGWSVDFLHFERARRCAAVNWIRPSWNNRTCQLSIYLHTLDNFHCAAATHVGYSFPLLGDLAMIRQESLS